MSWEVVLLVVGTVAMLAGVLIWKWSRKKLFELTFGVPPSSNIAAKVAERKLKELAVELAELRAKIDSTPSSNRMLAQYTAKESVFRDFRGIAKSNGIEFKE